MRKADGTSLGKGEQAPQAEFHIGLWFEELTDKRP